jgi:predicted RNase H-like HicB family nuclease
VVSREAERESDTECGIVVIVADGKALQRMRKNPTGWRIEGLQAVAEENFVEWRRPGSAGKASHLAGLHQAICGARRRRGGYRNQVRTTSNRNLGPYQFTVRALSKEEGGGYLVEHPDIPGCMSDGETIEEAIANGREALRDCVEVFNESGRKIPKPNIAAAQWRQRLPGPSTRS